MYKNKVTNTRNYKVISPEVLDYVERGTIRNKLIQGTKIVKLSKRLKAPLKLVSSFYNTYW